jgi:hypothetical protein
MTHQKWVLRNDWRSSINGSLESFDIKCLFIFDPLESISDEWKNFVLFPNRDLEILCRLLFESSELIFIRPKKFVSGESFSPQLCIFIFVIRKCKLERLLLYQLVEQNVLFEFFLSFDKVSEFLFFLNLDFWKIDFFTEKCFTWKEFDIRFCKELFTPQNF